jgi:hypothetical protein
VIGALAAVGGLGVVIIIYFLWRFARHTVSREYWGW